ncbi:putative DDE superfamily endonuclease [Monocercomonoides exilis]|uniref:putative DDE superfamily endonuclease n=1 Tax=Monocercomonoides exilis TaxID=2049356 RepID=UPI00355A309B|nr:putative DDE superfamily endonuclease [Monocercomonoides exilis]|eukprot:MONOS_2644.1-p1 / transcript=MONOS_2644.1 / gene=MONOS_2644 / organism=Monocercomonoides_exilis_PA203 / gene_product=unspecified product / transcript_product=unspecified product / location=Mono_scaffold00055:158245-159781(-) / protein_length=496 / sequence_SO=supercontig / SO=protein_coding / is_pseudo=false
MSSRKYRKYHSRLERMAHIVVDGVVRMTDAINSKEFSRTSIKNAVRALRKGRLVGKVGRPAAVVGEKEQRVMDIIHIEAKSGTCLTLKKTRELIENVINDNDNEDAPFTEVSMSATYGFVKRHPELKTGTPKNLDINRLAVSCRSVFKPWCKTFDEIHEKFHYNPASIINIDESSTRVPTDSKQLVVHTTDTKAGFTKEPPRMINSTFVAAVAADGYAFPSVILWPSAKLPEELKSLLSPTLEIWANGSGWMDNECFKRYALTVLLPSIIERRMRMSLENEHILLLLDSHASRADPSIWREFQKQQVDVLTFVPHSTHLCKPLDRGVFAVFKSELTNRFEAPSSSSSSSKRAAISDVLPQAIHTALSPSVIQKAFVCSGVLHNSSGPVLLKLPESSIYPLPSRRNRFNFYGKVITDEILLEKWENHLKMNIERKNEMDEKEKDEVKTVVDEKKKIKRRFLHVKNDDSDEEKKDNALNRGEGKRKVIRRINSDFVFF